MEELRICRDEIIIEYHEPAIKDDQNRINRENPISVRDYSNLNQTKPIFRPNTSVNFLLNNENMNKKIDKKALFLIGSCSLNKKLVIHNDKSSPLQKGNFTIRTFVKNKSSLNVPEFFKSLQKKKFEKNFSLDKEISHSSSRIFYEKNTLNSTNQSYNNSIKRLKNSSSTFSLFESKSLSRLNNIKEKIQNNTKKFTYKLKPPNLPLINMNNKIVFNNYLLN